MTHLFITPLRKPLKYKQKKLQQTPNNSKNKEIKDGSRLFDVSSSSIVAAIYICSRYWFAVKTAVFIHSYSESAIVHDMNGINICKKIVVL